MDMNLFLFCSKRGGGFVDMLLVLKFKKTKMQINYLLVEQFQRHLHECDERNRSELKHEYFVIFCMNRCEYLKQSLLLERMHLFLSLFPRLISPKDQLRLQIRLFALMCRCRFYNRVATDLFRFFVVFTRSWLCICPYLFFPSLLHLLFCSSCSSLINISPLLPLLPFSS